MKTSNLHQEVLFYLEQANGAFISGALIAEKLHVSRNAVYYSIKKLQHMNIAIETRVRKGYRLCPGALFFKESDIAPFADKRWHIKLKEEVTSTSTVLKEQGALGAPDGEVLIARRQTAGRGRMGRSFFSPPDSGLYLSFLLRPNCTAKDATLFTVAAAVAVARACESVCDCKAEIKWVNDVYVNGKKVCGILTEGKIRRQSDKLEYAVVGVGINLYAPKEGFPAEFAHAATALFDTLPERSIASKICICFLNEFAMLIQDLGSRCFLDEYRRRCFLMGKTVTLRHGNNIIRGKVLDIDNDARLVVEDLDGNRRVFGSGEVTSHIE